MTGMPDDLKPPIPATLASRPVKGGLAYPWVNVELADGGADYRSTHYARYEKAWTECRCQSCGQPTGARARPASTMRSTPAATSATGSWTAWRPNHQPVAVTSTTPRQAKEGWPCD